MVNNRVETGIKPIETHFIYSEAAIKPDTVLAQTHTNLQMYFNTTVEPGPLRDYFRDITCLFLRGALRGFKAYYADRKQRYPGDPSFRVIDDKVKLPEGDPSPEDREAFEHSRLVMGQLHDYETMDPVLGRIQRRPYSSRGALRSPQSTLDIATELLNNYARIQQIASGVITQDAKVIRIQDMLRMLAFYQVGYQHAMNEHPKSDMTKDAKRTIAVVQERNTLMDIVRKPPTLQLGNA